VKLSGRTFHVEACPGPSGPGTARCHAHLVTDRAGNILHDLGRGGRPMATRNAAPAGFGSVDLLGAYNLTALSKTGGVGVTVAIVDAYGYPNAASDLAKYRLAMGLPACGTGCFTKVNQKGGTSYPRNNTGWAQEQALDLDMVSAICPNCHILLVEANSANYSDLAAAENYAASQKPIAISNSYGGGEGGTTGVEPAYNHPNIAITVSTGDSGYGVQFPASSPHVTAVGGTSLVMSGGVRSSETAWSGGGSGCSTVYAKPTWQGDKLCGMRMEADTSAVADPNTPVAAYGPIFGNFSGWLEFGGTSVAAPLTAGVYALNGGSPQYQNQVPYQNTGSLFDITIGSNGSCPSADLYWCNAGAGYDGPTGLGTPNGATAF
jgi:subtilase family serine protease